MINFKLYYEEFKQIKRKERIAISQAQKSAVLKQQRLIRKDTVMTTTPYSEKNHLRLTTLKPRKIASQKVLQPVKKAEHVLASTEPSVAVSPGVAKRVIKIPVTFLD